MGKKYNLSYIITTRNKLMYLKETLKRLLENVQEDEEIIIIDGASTDGTVEYLTDLHQQNLIQQFLSEPDRGEAHGYNKGFLLARGEIIKVITDDDVFFYHGIQKCKAFMLAHPEIDVLGTEGIGTNWSIENPYALMEYLRMFKQWKDVRKCFAFCGLGLMIRRNSLAYTGLFNTGFIRVDAEFTMRVLALSKIRVAWYTGRCWLRMINPQSNSAVYSKNMIEELDKLEYLYLGKRTIEKSFWIKIYEGLKCRLFCVRNKIGGFHKKSLAEKVTEDIAWEQKYIQAEEHLEIVNKNSRAEFY